MKEMMTPPIEEPIYNKDGQVIDQNLAQEMAKIENTAQKKKDKKILGIFPRSEKQKEQIIKNGQKKSEKYAEQERSEIISENDLPEEVKEELKIWKDTYWSTNDLGSLEIKDIKKINLGSEEGIEKYKITGKLKKTGTLMPDEKNKRYSVADEDLTIIMSINNRGEITYAPESNQIPSFDRDIYEKNKSPEKNNC
jgi:hypothetical protein